jgi:N-acetylglutamate synthase-like GNAT family acetyltransferase
MIRRTTAADFEQIWEIINDGAVAYKGIIPADRWHEPYMLPQELLDEIAAGVEFWGCEEENGLVAVMGIQPVRDVCLIRHAYTRTASQKRGLGAQLLAHLHALATRPMLIGTWADASWAIHFYEKYGFARVSREEKERLLRLYWSIPERQVETSVVLADQRWLALKNTSD